MHSPPSLLTAQPNIIMNSAIKSHLYIIFLLIFDVKTIKIFKYHDWSLYPSSDWCIQRLENRHGRPHEFIGQPIPPKKRLVSYSQHIKKWSYEITGRNYQTEFITTLSAYALAYFRNTVTVLKKRPCNPNTHNSKIILIKSKICHQKWTTQSTQRKRPNWLRISNISKHSRWDPRKNF